MPEPLTITDPKDLETLDTLAQERGVTRERVLHETLARLRRDGLGDRATPEDADGWDEVFRMARQMVKATRPERRTSNHDWLYDENGLPA